MTHPTTARAGVPSWRDDLAASGPIWRSIAQQLINDARGGTWLLAGTAVCLATVVPFWVGTKEAPPLWLLGGILGVFALVALFWVGLANVTLQNQPQAARLVPGHVRRLRRSLLVGTAAAQAAAVGLVMLGIRELGLSGWGIWAVVSVVTLALIAIKRWPQWAGLIAFLPMTVVKITEQGQSWLATVLEHPALGAMALALLSGAFAWWAIQDGGAAHRRYNSRRQFWLDGFKQPAARPTWQTTLFNPIGPWTTRRRLTQLCQPHAPTVGRALFGLEPRLDLTVTGATWLGAIPMAALSGMAWWWVMSIGRPAHGFPWPILLVWGPMLCLGVVAIARTTFKRSGTEQALLRLCPGMPSGAALNRQIGRALLVRFLWLWALGSVASVVLLQATGILEPMLGLGLGMFALGTVMVTWRALTDWSRVVPGVRAGDVVFDFIGSLALGGMLLGLHWRFHVPPTLLVLGTVGAWLAMMAWRWRRLSRLPCAWPTGRLSGNTNPRHTAVTQGR